MKNKGPDPRRNIYIMELVGTKIEILEHTDPTLIGLQGTIDKETMRTFLIRVDERTKMVSKKGGRFLVSIMNEKGPMDVTVLGDDIIFRPVDRTKKCERKRPKRHDEDPEHRS